MWVDQGHTKGKSYKKQQLKLKYYLLRKKNYTLKKVLNFKVSAVKKVLYYTEHFISF